MRRALTISVLALAAALPSARAKSKAKQAGEPAAPFTVQMLDGGRRLDFLRTVSSEQELHRKRSLFNKIVDFVAGAPNWRTMVRPYDVATDSHDRLIVTDPGALAVHIFDFAKNKYTRIEGGKRDTFQSPIGVAVDDEDNIYVTDSQLGKVFVFDPRGKYRRTLGDIKGEGFFKRPTGIAFDRAARQLYITDTLRARVFVTDLNGNVVRYIGERGSEPGQFNFPTEVVVRGDDVLVVDAMNFRVQMFDRNGAFRAQFGSLGDHPGTLFRPKGLGVDVHGDVYLVDASMEAVQVFNREGQLLYSFGRSGMQPAEFELPSGIWVDGGDRIYVADSYNHRVQVFHFVNGAVLAGGEQ